MRAAHRIINKDDPKARFDFCDLPNCAFLSEHGKCSKLSVEECLGHTCSFCKTRDEVSRGDNKWQSRLAALDLDKQLAIAKKYYGGKMPWNSSDSSGNR